MSPNEYCKSLGDEAIGAIDRRKRAPFVGEWPPNVDCSVESTRKRSGRLLGLTLDSLKLLTGMVNPTR